MQKQNKTKQKKKKMRNRNPLLNKIIGKYAKSDVNENGEKLIELCSLHNLRIANTFYKLG